MESIIVNNILKSDFKREAEVQGFEVFDPETVLKIRKAENFLIKKSLTQELSEVEINQIDLCKSEVESLKSAYVINDETLKKEIVFFRERDLEKAASHRYFKREGTPGNYKYYYTEAEYKQAKGGESKEKKESYADSDEYRVKRGEYGDAREKGASHEEAQKKANDHWEKVKDEYSKKDSKTDITSTDKVVGTVSKEDADYIKNNKWVGKENGIYRIPKERAVKDRYITDNEKNEDKAWSDYKKESLLLHSDGEFIIITDNEVIRKPFPDKTPEQQRKEFKEKYPNEEYLGDI